MAELKIGSLCSGFGGLDMSVMDVLDAEVAWHCQYDPDDKHQYAARILDAHWPGVPNHGDITQIDWAAVEPIDILTAGFPCQDLSLAGKRAGLRDGNRSGLWFHVAQAIEQLRPSLVVIENVPGILSSEADGDLEPCPWCLGDLGRKRRPLRALGAVLADLAGLGFDAEWLRLGAHDVGAPHKRDRVFILAWPAEATAPDPTHFGHERSRQARLGRTGSADRGLVAADASSVEPERRGGPQELGGPAPAEQGEGHQRERAGDAAVDRGPAAADAEGLGWSEGRTEPAGLLRGPDVALGSSPDWGPYAPAIARWEAVMGRPSPSPTEPGKSGPRLAPRFVEWLMGCPDGWITGVGIPRNAQLKASGNGVVRQQGAEALRRLLAAADFVLAPSLPVPSTEEPHDG